MVPVNPPFLRAIGRPLLLTTKASKCVVRRERRTFFGGLNGAPQDGRCLRRFHRPPAIRTTEYNDRARFLYNEVALPRLHMEDNRNVVDLICRGRSQDVAHLVPIPKRPLSERRPSQDVLPPSAVFDRHFLRLHRRFPAVNGGPCPTTNEERRLASREYRRVYLTHANERLRRRTPIDFPHFRRAYFRLCLVVPRRGWFTSLLAYR